MTVCTASIINWQYGENEIGGAIVVASDRMYSDSGLGIEYESSRTKVAYIGQSKLLLVAGDLTMNSRAVAATMTWMGNNPDANTHQAANMYGQIIAALAFESAAKMVLNPLGIFTDEVLSDEVGLAKYGLPDALVVRIAEQLQAECLDSETIIAGCDGKSAYIYRIDGKGRVSLHNDIGFVSIGSGGIHSSAYFMQMPYDHNVRFSEGLVSTFFAKKRAEIAPGVGMTTDMSIINGGGIFTVPPDDIAALEKTYREARRRTTKLQRSLEAKFTQAMQKKHAPASPSQASATLEE